MVYLLPGLITEGRKRGLADTDIAKLTSYNPAQRFGLHTKGNIAVGYDADVCFVDDTVSYTVAAAESESAQEYTPFEGFQLTAKVTDTFLRGGAVLTDGEIVGEPRGQYLHRPVQRP